MSLTVSQRAETVATLRHVHVKLMETLAAWIPTSPEMEAKLLFGTHVWDVAQHADALGKRTYELRMPLQHSLAPVAAYEQWLADLAQVKDTAGRIACFYECALPALAARYRTYLGQTDALLDAPTVRILEHVAAEQQRMVREARELLSQIPALALADRARIEPLSAREAAIEALVAHRPERTAASA